MLEFKSSSTSPISRLHPVAGNTGALDTLHVFMCLFYLLITVRPVYSWTCHIQLQQSFIVHHIMSFSIWFGTHLVSHILLSLHLFQTVHYLGCFKADFLLNLKCVYRYVLSLHPQLYAVSVV